MRSTIRHFLAASVAGAAMIAASSASAADVKIGFLGGFTGPIETPGPADP